MAYKNANIKDVKEAITRLMDGEEFYFGGDRIYFLPRGDSTPFRISEDDTYGYPLASELNYLSEWKIKGDWRESLSRKTPRLCWVWDGNFIESERFVASIINYDGRYNTQYTWYQNAVPLTKEEIREYLERAED